MVSVNIESVSNVVADIYEAAYDQERWLDVVTGLRDLLDGARSCIVRFDQETVDAVSTVSYDLAFSSPEAIAAHMRDPLAIAVPAVAVGSVYRRTELVGREFLRSELWQDWFRPRDMYDGLAGNLLSSNGSCWIFDVHRGATQAAFDAAERELLQKFMPHLVRAGEIGRSFQKTSALASAFSHLPFGIVLVDGHQHPGQMNEAAEAMLARPYSPLCQKAGCVVASNPSDALLLQQMIVDACSSRDGALPGIGGTLLLPSASPRAGVTRLMLSVAPFLNARAYGLTSERCAVIMIREVTLGITDGFEEHIRALFELTKAEARVAATLAVGQSLKEAAVQGGVTIKTARTYLDRIFRKTGTNQQSSLVALLKSVQPIVADRAKQ